MPFWSERGLIFTLRFFYGSVSATSVSEKPSVMRAVRWPFSHVSLQAQGPTDQDSSHRSPCSDTS